MEIENNPPGCLSGILGPFLTLSLRDETEHGTPCREIDPWHMEPGLSSIDNPNTQ